VPLCCDHQSELLNLVYFKQPALEADFTIFNFLLQRTGL